MIITKERIRELLKEAESEISYSHHKKLYQDLTLPEHSKKCIEDFFDGWSVQGDAL